ncbi:amino acid transporter [Saccharomyces paradoxus]|uniref:Amino acid transporter n=1 Tax=Saccharomyces paradoxus TaxID=27291 RepID=A0A8B8ULJ9_SACPA|nr:Avt5 [Saccharomyces paradoxus]QHS71484.1 Avt5 [Saccharomyces paradoxus]
MPSNVRSGVLTLLHTACGAGVLAMPFAFKPFGLMPGLITLTFCGICSLCGLLLQTRIAKYVPKSENASFAKLTQLINPSLSIVFDFAIAVKCFGVGVSYLIIVGDLVPQIAQSIFYRNDDNIDSQERHIFLDRRLYISLVMVSVISPLCFKRSLNSLRYASMIAIISVAYLSGLIIYHFVNRHQLERGQVYFMVPHRDSQTHSPLTTLPIFVFAYTCHHNMFSVINEQADKSFKVLRRIPILAIALAYFLYIIIGGTGYMTFGENIVGNILTLYPNSISTTIGRLAMLLLVMLAFPLQCHPCRSSVKNIIIFIENFRKGKLYDNRTGFIPLDDLSNEDPQEGLTQQNNEEPNLRIESLRYTNIITLCILLFSYILAISITSLAKVLAIVGATGSTSISFILPGLFGYKLIGSEFTDRNERVPFSIKIFKYLGLFLFIWGIAVMVASLSATVFLGTSSH